MVAVEEAEAKMEVGANSEEVKLIEDKLCIIKDEVDTT